jgi:hypothetical protein
VIKSELIDYLRYNTSIGDVYMYEKSLFVNANLFAVRFVNSLLQTAAIMELVEWSADVNIGLLDSTLPDEIKEQVLFDYREIEKQFTQMTGSINGN